MLSGNATCACLGWYTDKYAVPVDVLLLGKAWRSRKNNIPVSLHPSEIPHVLESNPGLRGEGPSIKLPNHTTAWTYTYVLSAFTSRPSSLLGNKWSTVIFFTAFVFLRHQRGKDAGENISVSFSVDFPWIGLWHIINEAENNSDKSSPYFRPFLTRNLWTNIYLNRLHYMFHLSSLNRLKLPLLYNKIHCCAKVSAKIGFTWL